MSETAAEWLAKLAGLNSNDRYEIAHRLLDSLADEGDPAWEECWAVELKRRAAMPPEGDPPDESADEVVANLRKKYSSQ